MTNATRLVLFVAALLMITACATPQPKSDKPLSPPEQDDPYFSPAALPPGPEVLPEFTESNGTAADPTHPVTRAELDAFIQRGPHHPLTLVQLQPAFESGAFVGFEVTGLTDHGRKTLGTAVQPGDVILQINGHDIARPEDYMGAWESLKTCSVIEVELLRSGERKVRSWPVEDTKRSEPTSSRNHSF